MREDPDSELPVWYIEQQAFLKRHGFAFFEVQLDMKTLFPFPWPVWCIFIGPHRTSTPENEIRHAIVGMIDGAKLVPMFDPLGQPGEDPASAFVSKKVVAVCFLVPTDPAKLLLRPEGVELFKPNGRQ